MKVNWKWVGIGLLIFISLPVWPLIAAGYAGYQGYKNRQTKDAKFYFIGSAVSALIVFPLWTNAISSEDNAPSKQVEQAIKQENTQPNPTTAPNPTATDSPTQIVSNTTQDVITETSASTTEASGDLFVVTRIVDGDTIVINTGETVRLIGIDTPETNGECYSSEATNKLSSLINGKTVKLEKDVSETDRYDRLLRYIWIGDQFINEIMVREGYAEAKNYPPDSKYVGILNSAEDQARSANLGIWSACSTPPTPTTAPVTSSTSNGACDIKGNINREDEKIYHVPGCRDYNKTKINESNGERWFCSESEAVQAGWRKALSC